VNGIGQFVASIVQSIAWPVAMVVLALTFRTPLTELIQRLTAIKGPGVEVVAEARLSAASAVVSAVADSVHESRVGAPQDQFGFEHLWALAETQPASAVLQAYEVVEIVLRGILGAPELGSGDNYLPTKAVRVAAEKGLVEESSIAAVDGLAVLRDLVVHGGAGDVTSQKAGEYVSLVFATVYALRHPRRS